jgi:pimeloyl-ACP methyl ester carboxylesterase
MLPSPTCAHSASGFGSVDQVPELPPGFGQAFRSRYIDTGAIRLHAVIGGDGPPLLLVAGWPQTWYAWRHLMPALAEDFTVLAIDPRGVGLSDRPETGYDTGTLAQDLVDAMARLGHRRFAMIGHDVGMWIGYALAGDHPNVLEWLVLAEAAIPGVSPSPPLIGHSTVNDRLWHFGFNRLAALNEELVQGREHLFFGHQFASKAATPRRAATARHRPLHQDPGGQPGRTARELRPLSGDRRHDRAERAPQGVQAGPPGADDRRCAELGRPR